ncbi:hypothetical protein J2T13_002899 [Paenibacillus sp. DS2015]
MLFRLEGITNGKLRKRRGTSWRLTVNVGKDASGKYIRYGKTAHDEHEIQLLFQTLKCEPLQLSSAVSSFLA